MSRLQQISTRIWSESTAPQTPLLVAQWIQEATRVIESLETRLEQLAPAPEKEGGET